MSLNSVDENLIQVLDRALPNDVIRPVTPRYLEELRRKWRGIGGCLALPRSVQDVSTLVQIAHSARVPVVPFGGGTGLVCGQIYTDGPAPIILSLERLNAIRAVDPVENVLIAEAGAILQTVQQAAESEDRMFPLSIAASGSAQIGGNLATNAGGVNVLRYGNTRDLCLGLEAVLPDGRIWNGLSRLRKDNTGYDLKNLLIGSEGTLGVITAASLKLFPRPRQFGTALMAVTSPQAALELLSIARDLAGEAISAFELIHANGYRFLAQHMPQVAQPFSDIPKWSVLVDLGLSGTQDAQALIESLFEMGFEAGLVTDGVLASSAAQRDGLWALRESIPEANRAVGAIASHDVSLPLRQLPAFIETASQALARIGDMRINCFGHLGDGNLHFNLFPANGKSAGDYQGRIAAITETVHDLVHSFDGSISAEHGVGRAKAAELPKYKDATAMVMMRAIKQALDPEGIMNPGVLFPQET